MYRALIAIIFKNVSICEKFSLTTARVLQYLDHNFQILKKIILRSIHEKFGEAFQLGGLFATVGFSSLGRSERLYFYSKFRHLYCNLGNTACRFRTKQRPVRFDRHWLHIQFWWHRLHPVQRQLKRFHPFGSSTRDHAIHPHFHTGYEHYRWGREER